VSAALNGLRDLANYASRLLAAKRPAPGTYWSDQGTRTEQYAASVLAENVLDLVVACIADDEPDEPVVHHGLASDEADLLRRLLEMRAEVHTILTDDDWGNEYKIERALLVLSRAGAR
jgi:hypothetical protein